MDVALILERAGARIGCQIKITRTTTRRYTTGGEGRGKKANKNNRCAAWKNIQDEEKDQQRWTDERIKIRRQQWRECGRYKNMSYRSYFERVRINGGLYKIARLSAPESDADCCLVTG